MENKLLFIEQLEHCDPVFVACSGGIDSMVLLHLLQKLKLPLSVLHCNFQLRGQDSIDDEEFVRSYCEKNKIPFLVKRFDTNSKLKNENQSVQEIARNLRYEWFDEIFKSYPDSLICTAHHAEDNEEQVWLRLLSSGRLLDLGGIPAYRDQFVRPMLPISKSEILDYAKRNNLKWREDSSNSKTDYTRNKIRLQLKPLLEKIDPRHSNAIGRLSQEIQQLREEIPRILNHHFGFDLIGGQFFVSEEFWEQQLSIVKQILLEYWRESNTQLTEIEKFYCSAKLGSILEFQDGHYVIRENQGLWFGNERYEQFDAIQLDLNRNYKPGTREHIIKADFQLLEEKGELPNQKYQNITVKKPEIGESVLLKSGKLRKVKKIWNDDKWSHHERKTTLGYYSEELLISIFPMKRLEFSEYEFNHFEI